ncbi:hypothetical protein FRB93_010045 [Tulasnella sp. JGI-2019a]|nr:hypothetical protein FRB93_010045 [Tulasnella sp. JGI-2019a]
MDCEFDDVAESFESSADEGSTSMQKHSDQAPAAVPSQTTTRYYGTPTTSSFPEILGKGKACLQCRSQKRRCDGKRPICSNCTRGKKQCTFKETTVYSRARKRDLLQTVDVLEAKLAELESVRAGQPSGQQAYPGPEIPAQLSFCEALSSSVSNHISFMAEGSGSRNLADKRKGKNDEWWLQDPPPPPMQKHLLDIFISNKNKPLYYLHVDRFWQSLAPDCHTPPHSGLLNVMYLLACYWSNDPALLPLQPHFLSVARRYQAETLGKPGINLIQWLEASCLLAYYLSDNCRCLEARQEISGAIPLLMLCKLHNITSSTWRPSTIEGNNALSMDGLPFLVSPPKDSTELGQRIWLFWMAYTFDLMISLVYGLEPNRALVAETTTVWPRSPEEYEHLTFPIPDGSCASLFVPDPPHPFDPPCSLFALRCKAAVILARVTLFATSCTTEYIRTPAFFTRFHEFHKVVSTCLEGLPPIQYDPLGAASGASTPQINLVIFSVHTVTLFIHIQLYDAAGLESDVFSRLYDRRLTMARRIALLTRAFISSGINPGRLPIMCTACWFPVASVLAQHVRRLRLSNDETNDLQATQADLSTMLIAVAELSKVFSMYTFALDRLQAYINGDSDTELSTSLLQVAHRG